MYFVQFFVYVMVHWFEIIFVFDNRSLLLYTHDKWQQISSTLMMHFLYSSYHINVIILINIFLTNNKELSYKLK